MTLKSLIAELEQAKEGNRELSDRVLLAVGWLGQSASSKVAGILVPHWKSPDGRDVLVDLRPCPTTSLDAALTLVPKNCGWHVDNDGEACIFRLEKGKGQAGWPIIGECDNSKRHYEPAPALALCVAALKARDKA
ncbi:hypothetical protein LCGC14_1741200 [marine sediment metagenome]|uniref:Phage ABA sandwich domain-containing protein n=1 Tax=marine sediment metagenome TaxID=412755 RepID=A0A0F9JLT4_9ZZZZ